MKNQCRCLSVLVLLISFFSITSEGKIVRYELFVRNQKMNLSGKKEVDFALTVNGGIPAPTLEFTEGDEAEITVHNQVPEEEVSIHWHGILLPPLEDGVSYVNTPPIYSGKSRIFRFKIRQNGTYWYHSHTGLQEQKGVFGAIVIHPQKKQVKVDHDQVLVLSDWSDENPDDILKNLRKDGDYYLYKKNTRRSYLEAWSLGKMKSYFKNQWARMEGMDLSDVGYDAFLINGKKQWSPPVYKAGEKVRLRVINAAASTYFYARLGAEPFEVIAADGVNITPVKTREILMGMAETYDLLVTIPRGKKLEFRATAQDLTGSTSTWLGEGEPVKVPVRSQSDPYEEMSGHQGHGSHESENHESENHSLHQGQVDSNEHSQHGGTTEHSQHGVENSTSHSSEHSHHEVESEDEERVVDLLSVDSLKAVSPTDFKSTKKIHELKLVLGGDMARYIWHINGKAIFEDRLIEVDEGDIVRFVFANETMMHHPMHLHGHFFRVLNSEGKFSPLKHTVDVSPHGSRTIEFQASEPGQWMLHCHNLYHMKTGMARVMRYKNFQMTSEMKELDEQDHHRHDHLYTQGRVQLASNFSEFFFRGFQTWNQWEFRAEAVPNSDSVFSKNNHWETEGELFYRRWLGNYLNVFAGGVRVFEREFLAGGVAGVLPLLIESQLQINSEGKIQMNLEKKFWWTKTLFSDVDLGWKQDLDSRWQRDSKVSLMYSPAWRWSLGLFLKQDYGGLGGEFQF